MVRLVGTHLYRGDGSVVANSGLYFLLQRYPVNLVTPFGLLSPIFAVIGGILFLDDVLTLGLIIGGILILFGVTYNRQIRTDENAQMAKS